MKGVSRKEHDTLSDINVTPFVDIVLVLLIIFMISAPLIRGSFDVNLPDSISASEVSSENSVTITIYPEGTIKVDGEKVSEANVVVAVKQRMKNESSLVFIEADEDAPYKFIAKVLDRLREGGIKKVGLMTEPLR